jgi:hypothetical protein
MVENHILLNNYIKMSYKIIEVHIEYHENKIEQVAVLWKSNERGWVRASYMTTKPCPGYGFLEPGFILSPELIQEVAGSGMNLPDEEKKKYFPGKRLWER